MHRFSTSSMPRQKRLPFLHDFVGRQVARWQFNPLSDDLSLDIGACALSDDLRVAKVRYSPIAGERTRELLADGRHDFMLTVHEADHEIHVENGPPIHVRAGDLLLVNEGIRSRFRLPAIQANLVSLGYSKLMQRLPGLASRSHYHVPAASAGVGLVRGYAELLYRNAADAAGAADMTGEHLYDLVAHALKGHLKSDADRTRAGVGAARLAIARKEIAGRLREPGLGIADIARSQGVTPRYLQRLFEAAGQSFSELLRDCRLDLAFADLGDDARVGVSISAIAYDCGFSDLSHFNRCFRKRFGRTPSDVRAAAMLKRRG